MTKKRQREYQNYLFGDKIILSVAIIESKDGHIIVPKIKGKDIHLTTYIKDEKILSHTTISDKEMREYKNHNEILKTDFVQGIIGDYKTFRKRFRKYRNNQKCMALSEEFLQKILQKTGKLETDIDFLQLLSLGEDIEILQKQILKKTRISDLRASLLPIGFGRRRIFVPVNDKQMIVLKENFFQQTFDFILDSLGISSYLEEFFSTPAGKKFLSEAKELAEEQHDIS